MKRMKRNPGKFETLGLYRALERQEGYTFSDPESSHKFIKRLENEFNNAKSVPSTIHGIRTQVLFEYIASSLGRCAVIKSEDSGEVYHESDNLEVPDYRILLKDGQEFFVEVKNYKQNQGLEPYTFKKAYLDKLVNYASLFRKELKLAVYWVGWDIWTLVPFVNLRSDEVKYTLSIEDALMYNEMYLLGDLFVATIPPLVLRLVADITKPRTIEPNGRAKFTIGGLEFYCDDRKITDSFEMGLAFYFMLYSRWEVAEGEVEIDNEQLVAIRYTVKPEEVPSEHEFVMLGSKSEMISKCFNLLTASSDGAVERLSPKTDSISLGLTIPDDYKGKSLPVWTFTMIPGNEQQT